LKNFQPGVKLFNSGGRFVQRVATLYHSSIGKKYVMAITGLIGVGFVIGHMIGNLQAFPFLGGEEKLNAYSASLRHLGGLLLAVRLTLLIAVVLHIVAAYQLTRMSLESRPKDYSYWRPRGSDYASRTMRWSGPILALFIIYHLLHLTFGTVHPNFNHGNVYENVVTGFQVWYVSAFYIVAIFALGLHLYHGAWSMFQSLGLNNDKLNRRLHLLAAAITFILVAGNISVPLAVLAGYIS
jgi:succinate dehydrogenase / fumarate reductase cytochrome b subunit